MGRKGQIPWNRKAPDDATILRLYLQDRLSGMEIAARYGLHFTAIYDHLERLGVTRTNAESHVGLQVGERNPNWKGGRWQRKGKYVSVSLNGSVFYEHRLVAEQTLGRPLKPGEVVHHRNEDKTDNRPENLQVLSSNSEHMRLHMTTKKARRLAKLQNEKRKAAALEAVGYKEG